MKGYRTINHNCRVGQITDTAVCELQKVVARIIHSYGIEIWGKYEWDATMCCQ